MKGDPMKEFVVTAVSGLESPHTLTDKATGKVFSMVTLEIQFIHPSGQPDQMRLHFAPTHLQTILPTLAGTIQMALAGTTATGSH